MAILCNHNNTKFKATYGNSCKTGRHLSIKVETELQSYTITNIYAPNIPKKRKIFFQKLETCISDNTNNILGGDFNMVEDVPNDRAGGNPTTQHYGIEHIKNIKNRNNMIDIWRKQNPKKKEYTYFNNLADFKSRIDRFYLTTNIEINYKIKTQIIQNYLSDHRMIKLSIHKKNEKKRGPSYWKLNSSILENKEYKNKITSFWQKWQQRKPKYDDPTVWWDNGKQFIQGITKDFCTELKEKERKQLHLLN